MGEPSTTDRKPTRRTKLMIAAAGGLVALTMAAIVLCGLLDIRSSSDLFAYRAMMRGDFHAIWKDLAWRRVRKGDDLAETIRRHPPVSRVEMRPFTVLLYNGTVLGSFELQLRVVAANGVLIEALAACSDGKHVFFESPAQRQAFRQACEEYGNQQRLESKAYQVHRATAAGQDVFLSEQIQQRELPPDSPHSKYDPETYRLLVQAFGAEYVQSMLLRNFELTVEVSKVLHGDLEPGTTLTFFGKECDEADLAETPTVFLHVEDSRTVDPDSEGGELYQTVPRKALEWYQSLTLEQIKDFEARYRSELAKVETGT